MTKYQLDKLVKQRNAAFTAASPSQRRVMVAKDVIDRITQGSFTPVTGEWVKTRHKPDVSKTNKSLQKALICDELQCECCALGGLMLSNVSFQNNIKTDEAGDLLYFNKLNPKPKSLFEDPTNYGLITHVKIEDKSRFMKLFSKKQLALIEYAYEGGFGYYDRYGMVKMGFDEKTIDRALGLYVRFAELRDDKDNSEFKSAVQLSIMRNIVENNGKFVP